MKKCIRVSTVTNAQKAQRILHENNIRAFASKQLRPFDNGCAWCVMVNNADLNKSIDIMSSYGVKMTGEVYNVYR